MKPAPFEYYAPTTVEEALSHLAEHGYDAKPLAGGQSLIPMMNFRLAEPAVLVDLNNIPSLSFIRADEDGSLRIGAMTRHAQVEHDRLVAERAPLIHETMPMIATTQIRSRGTFGGSISHADPSAELVAVSVILDGRFHVHSQAGDRWVPAHEFFIGICTTQMEPVELLTEIAIPPLQPRSGWALMEIARRPHDFALVGVAAVVTLDEDRRCQGARIGMLSVGDGPVEAYRAAAALIGQAPTPEAMHAAAEIAASEDIDPGSDIHASANYRRHLVKVLAQRALKLAFGRASRNVQ
jgi:carbon-monoxide dehydrogenase medium subunit